MTDDYDYDASDLRPRRPDTRRTIVKTPSLLVIAVLILGIGFLLCLGGIIALAMANPARSIPDVLVATTTGILGLIGGILIPTRRNADLG